MKYKSSKAIVIAFTGIIVVGLVIGFDYFKVGTKETGSYTKSIQVANLIKDKTSIEIMKISKVENQKGPIPSLTKKAYITIDDGPSKYTDAILDILNKNDVKATFFMIDRNMKNYQQQVKRIEEEGHSAGFHSVSHDIKKLYKNPQATLNEFETCKETFYDITGDISKLIRLPYGSKPYMPEGSHSLLELNGYKMWDWNLDTQDWKATSDNIVSNILYYGRDNYNLVILMHEKQQSVEALESTIKILKEREYEILPITEDLQERNYWDKNL